MLGSSPRSNDFRGIVGFCFNVGVVGGVSYVDDITLSVVIIGAVSVISSNNWMGIWDCCCRDKRVRVMG